MHCSTEDLIRHAIQSDDFLKHLSPATVIQLVDCMNAEYINKESNIIMEGEVGSKLYVIEGNQGMPVPPTVTCTLYTRCYKMMLPLSFYIFYNYFVYVICEVI